MFSRLLDFSADDVDSDASASSSRLANVRLDSLARDSSDGKPLLNVFVLVKGLFEWEAEFSSTLFELITDARRVG